MTKTKTEPGAVRTKKVEIEMPEGLYDLLEKVCKVMGLSVADFILKSTAGDLDMELQDHLGNQLGFPMVDGEYREYIESLAWPDPEAQEVTA